MTSASHAELVARMNDAFDGLVELCADLTEAEWKTPTQLPGWSVQDNLSHLIAFERRLEGLPEGGHEAPKADHVRNALGIMTENDVDSRRHLSGAEVYAQWLEVVALRRATLAAAGPEYFAAPSDTPAGPGTMADFLWLRVMDTWTHGQDMRRAINKPGHRGGPAAIHTIEHIERMIGIVVGKRAGTPEGGAVVFHLTGGLDHIINVVVIDGKGKVQTTAPANVLATISLDSDDFVQLAMGRNSYTNLADGISINGDNELALRVLTNMVLMI